MKNAAQMIHFLVFALAVFVGTACQTSDTTRPAPVHEYNADSPPQTTDEFVAVLAYKLLGTQAEPAGEGSFVIKHRAPYYSKLIEFGEKDADLSALGRFIKKEVGHLGQGFNDYRPNSAQMSVLRRSDAKVLVLHIARYTVIKSKEDGALLFSIFDGYEHHPIWVDVDKPMPEVKSSEVETFNFERFRKLSRYN